MASLFRRGQADRLDALRLYPWALAQGSDDIAQGFWEVSGSIYNDGTTEALTSSAAQTLQADFVGALAEVLAGADSPAALADFLAATAETLNATGTETGNADYPVALVETLAGSDAQEAVLAFNADLTEALGLTESQEAQAEFAPTASEALASSEAQQGLVDFLLAEAEVLTSADSQESVAEFQTAEAEALAASESQTGAAEYLTAQTEAMIGAEIVAASADFVTASAEALTALDVQDAEVVASPNFMDEAISLIDLAGAEWVGFVTQADLLAAEDSTNATLISDSAPTYVWGGSWPIQPRKKKKKKPKFVFPKFTGLLEEEAAMLAAVLLLDAEGYLT